MDIDYRPYTWESSSKASEVYNLASNMCSGVIGNDEEFGVLAENYDAGFSFAKKLSDSLKFLNFTKFF